ncbi:MAG: hypothetical protein GX665_11830 [Gammaproteobacteria bacterium]|nr:hypothetical protein [Gammaproteobacteria bacterium]
MTIFQYAHFFLLALLGLIAALGVFVRGRKFLGLIMASTCALHATGMQYIIHSQTASGFSESIPFAYSIARAVVDMSLFVYLICVAVVCWARVANYSIKPTR